MRILAAVIPSLALTACIDFGASVSSVVGDDEVSEEGNLDTDECKIEGSQIGQDGLVMRLGSKSVTFSDWVTKPGEPNEFMGFTLAIHGASSVGYVVKAGTERYPSRATTWLHPQGPKANAISYVDVCEECSDGSCDDSGGEDDGGDGCIEGCDGGGSGGDGPLT